MIEPSCHGFRAWVVQPSPEGSAMARYKLDRANKLEALTYVASFICCLSWGLSLAGRLLNYALRETHLPQVIAGRGTPVADPHGSS